MVSGMVADEIKRWLCGKLTGVESVRGCQVAKDGHLIAHTWTGTLIYVYLLDEPVRVRNLKRILSEGTRVGVGSLFIVDAALVPSDGALTTPD